LAAEGVDVGVSSSSMERAEEAATKIVQETGGKAIPMVGDVSSPNNMNTLYEDSKKALGGSIDILSNNHGGPAVGSALELDEAELIS
jgi:short-subunit dehydrogenase